MAVSLPQYLQHFLSRVQLDHSWRDGVRYQRCRSCGSEWRAGNPGDPVNPHWWECPNGCNADAGRLPAPKLRSRP